MIVTDASVLYTALAEGGTVGRRFRRRLSGEELAAPDIVDVEVTSVLRRHVRAGIVDHPRAEEILGDLRELPINRIAARQLIPRCWELRDNVTVCDALYIALAEALGCTLVTADTKLANGHGSRCRIELLR